MKKIIKMSVSAFVVICLFTIPAVFAQQPKEFTPPKGAMLMTLQADGNTLGFRLSNEDGVALALNFEGKLNGKSIEFMGTGFRPIIVNDGKLSDEEIRLARRSLDALKSAVNRNKFEAPGISSRLKADGKSLQADIKSGAVVFEGKIEGTINGKPLEFKSDDGGAIIVNNGELSDNEIRRIVSGLTVIQLK